jgi:hypothetical protein
VAKCEIDLVSEVVKKEVACLSWFEVGTFRLKSPQIEDEIPVHEMHIHLVSLVVLIEDWEQSKKRGEETTE